MSLKPGVFIFLGPLNDNPANIKIGIMVKKCLKDSRRNQNNRDKKQKYPDNFKGNFEILSFSSGHIILNHIYKTLIQTLNHKYKTQNTCLDLVFNQLINQPGSGWWLGL